MAIAYDNISTNGWGFRATDSISHTNTGNLIFAVVADSQSTPITAVTYAGQNMTLLSTINTGGNNWSTGSPAYASIYYLVNPAQGTNNLVITRGANTTNLAWAVSYKNVGNTQPDSSNSAYVVSSITPTVLTTTTQISNSWVGGLLFYAGNITLSAGTNTTMRAFLANAGTAGTAGVFDSNAGRAKGNNSLNVNLSGAGNQVLWIAWGIGEVSNDGAILLQML